VAEPAAPDAAPGAALDGAEARAAVASAISTLDEDFRVAVVFRDIEGMSYEAIAEILQVPVGTVRSRIHRGREALRKALEPFMLDRGSRGDPEVPEASTKPGTSASAPASEGMRKGA
jgi:DNA-directed RNA polymerase specialized sigma24 family protein